MTAKKKLRVTEYIEHILNAIERIEQYATKVNQNTLQTDFLVQDAIIRNFAVISEATNKIQRADPTYSPQHPDFRLDLAYKMRNVLVHDYDQIDCVVLWNTIRDDLPTLKQQATAALAQRYLLPPDE